MRQAIRWRWLKLRGLTGEFDLPEDSDRCRALAQAWERSWPDSVPVGHRLREAYRDRWVRFDILPQSKRYAESPEEYAQIVRRQRTLLSELLGGASVADLIAVAEDWDRHDLATGRSRRYLPEAWPWRKVVAEDSELGDSYLWVSSALTDPDLDALLIAIADHQAHAILTVPELTWLFCPYDGGVDVLLPSTQARDALRDAHPEWAPTHPFGR